MGGALLLLPEGAPQRVDLEERPVWFGTSFHDGETLHQCRYERETIGGWIREVDGANTDEGAIELHALGRSRLEERSSCPEPPGSVWGQFEVDRTIGSP